MTARQIMTPDVGCCTQESTLQDVARMMVDCDCGCIPVVENMENRRLVGVITDRDIACRATANGVDPSQPIAQYMTVDVARCGPDTDVADCERMMQDRQVRRLPIVSENGSVLGLIAQADIALARPDGAVSETVRKVSQPYMA
jgi:CBS domain-containing protein